MQFWRSRARIFLSLTLGFFLAWALHACQPPQAPQVSTDVESKPSVTTPQPDSKPEPTALPPETEAILATLGPDGLYDPPRGDVRFVVISDLNGVYGSVDYDPEVDQGVNLIPFWNPDMVLCSGDMVAGQDPTLTDERLRAMWKAFDEHVASRLRNANLPYGFTMGNHDASSALGVTGKFLFDRERNIASEYWNDPAHDPGLQFIDRFDFPYYYTFKYDDIFFMAWDGSSHHIPDDKLKWIDQTLASREAQSAKMRILVSHLPLYAISVGRDSPGEVMENADQLKDMLVQHNVHTYISGHHHTYYPAHKGELQLLHMGILGSGPRPFIDSKLPPRKTLTVLDVNYDSPELTTYTTYDMQTLKQIENEELPRFVAGHNGMILRRDMKMDDLTADEKSFCVNRLGANLCSA